MPITTRRELLATLGSHFMGVQAANVAAPLVDFMESAPTWNVNAALQGMRYGYGQAVDMLVHERPHPSWPYVHCVCHCYAVASMDASEEERIAWSRLGGRRDELMQTFWAQFYRGSVHRFVVKHIQETNSSLKDAESEYDTYMKFVWGNKAEQSKAAVKCRLARGREKFRELANVRNQLYPLVDACESAWQLSDQRDNELGLQGGLKCPRGLDDERRLAWCLRWCEDHGLSPDTPEGPGTDREWGPFHPLHAGPPWVGEPHEQPIALVEISSYDAELEVAR